MAKALRCRSVEESLSELEREIQVRDRCYRRWVKEGKMTATDAVDRYERMASAIYFIRDAIETRPDLAKHVPAVKEAPKAEGDKAAEDDMPF